jgi:hypothetical protein
MEQAVMDINTNQKPKATKKTRLMIIPPFCNGDVLICVHNKTTGHVYHFIMKKVKSREKYLDQV